MVVTGRVLYGERIRDALLRHLEKDLGPLALPDVPPNPAPFTVVEYFPDPSVSGFHDPRHHAVSLVYVVPVAGDCVPTHQALDLAWFTPAEAVGDWVRGQMTGGHDRSAAPRPGPRRRLALTSHPVPGCHRAPSGTRLRFGTRVATAHRAEVLSEAEGGGVLVGGGVVGDRGGLEAGLAAGAPVEHPVVLALAAACARCRRSGSSAGRCGRRRRGRPATPAR